MTANLALQSQQVWLAIEPEGMRLGIDGLSARMQATGCSASDSRSSKCSLGAFSVIDLPWPGVREIKPPRSNVKTF